MSEQKTKEVRESIIAMLKAESPLSLTEISERLNMSKPTVLTYVRLLIEEDVIVPVHEQERREELKDQALEEIILSANEDYKEIEKQRHRQDNQLKAFDDQKLPGRGKMEDEIIDYVEANSNGKKYKYCVEIKSLSINSYKAVDKLYSIIIYILYYFFNFS